MKTYRSLLFISIIATILFYQLIHGQFYNNIFMNEVNESVDTRLLEIQKTTELLETVSTKNKYQTTNEWLHGRNIEEQNNTLYWSKTDAVLNELAQIAYENFINYENVIRCPNGNYAILADYLEQKWRFDMKDIAFYYNQEHSNIKNYTDYELCIYPKDLASIKTVWKPQKKENLTEHNSDGPNDGTPYVRYSDYKLRYWHNNKMLNAIYCLQFRLYPDFSYKYLKIPGGIYKGNYAAIRYKLDEPPECSINLNLTKETQMSDYISQPSKSYKWGCSTSDNGLQNCHKLNYVPKR